MASRDDSTNTIFHAGRDAAAQHLATTPLDPVGMASLGIGTCDSERAGRGWAAMPHAQRVTVLTDIAIAQGYDPIEAARIADFQSRLFGAVPDERAIRRDVARLQDLVPARASKAAWTALPQLEFDRRMFWLAGGRIAGMTRSSDPEVVWVFTRAMLCHLASIVPNPFLIYFLPGTL